MWLELVFVSTSKYPPETHRDASTILPKGSKSWSPGSGANLRIYCQVIAPGVLFDSEEECSDEEDSKVEEHVERNEELKQV